VVIPTLVALTRGRATPAGVVTVRMKRVFQAVLLNAHVVLPLQYALPAARSGWAAS
jgi:hypothetical protein